MTGNFLVFAWLVLLFAGCGGKEPVRQAARMTAPVQRVEPPVSSPQADSCNLYQVYKFAAVGTPPIRITTHVIDLCSSFISDSVERARTNPRRKVTFGEPRPGFWMNLEFGIITKTEEEFQIEYFAVDKDTFWYSDILAYEYWQENQLPILKLDAEPYFGCMSIWDAYYAPGGDLFLFTLRGSMACGTFWNGAEVLIVDRKRKRWFMYDDSLEPGVLDFFWRDFNEDGHWDWVISDYEAVKDMTGMNYVSASRDLRLVSYVDGAFKPLVDSKGIPWRVHFEYSVNPEISPHQWINGKVIAVHWPLVDSAGPLMQYLRGGR